MSHAATTIATPPARTSEPAVLPTARNTIAALVADVTSFGRPFWGIAACALAYTLAYAVAISVTTAPTLAYVDLLGALPAYVAAPVACYLAARRRTPARRAWLWLMGAGIFFALTGIAAAVNGLVPGMPAIVVHLSSVLAVSAYPFYGVGLSLVPASRRSRSGLARIWLDAVIIAASLLGLDWFFLTGPAFFSGGVAPDVVALCVITSVCDLSLTVVIVVLLLRGVADQYRAPFALAALGQLCLTYADSVYVFLALRHEYHLGTVWDDPVYIAAGCLLALAPLLEAFSRRRPAVPAAAPADTVTPESLVPSWRRLLLPYIPVAALFAATVAASVLQTDARVRVALDVLCALVIGLIAVRQVLALRENGISTLRLFEANEHLSVLRDEALQAERLKSEFLANMSHEIRTPMNGILGLTEIVLESDLTPELRDYMRTIYDSGEALLTILNDILDLSKIEAGKLTLESVAFDPREVTEGVAELLATKAAEKHLPLLTWISPRVPAEVVGDPVRLRQVLLNLAGNAVKFTSAGRVVLCVDVAETSEDGAQVVLRCEVRDTGIGLSNEARVRLFQPFTQADGSTTRKYGGTGLGLSICKRLVELMGGQIDVKSAEGRGSTFWFTVPARVASRQNAPATNSLTTVRGRSVLVVEDDEISRYILTSYAQAWGMRVVGVADARTALRALQEAAADGAPFDAALLDLVLPDGDGFTLAEHIRAHLAVPPTLVLLTAFDEAGLGQQAIARGFGAFLAKPVRQTQLRAALARVLAGTVPATAAPIRPRAEDALPIERQSVAHAGALYPPHATLGPRILVADDNAVNRKLAVLQIEKLGYVATAAETGAEAVRMLATGGYAAVLMDCYMPEMDGYAATAALRERERATGGHLPVIAMTANALQGERDRCLAAGMDDYISKPTGLETLRTVLVRWVGSAAPTEAGPHTPQPISMPHIAVALPAVPPSPQPSQSAGPAEGSASGWSSGRLPTVVRLVPQEPITPIPSLAESGQRSPARGTVASVSSVASVLDQTQLATLRALQTPGAPVLIADLAGEFLRESADGMASLRAALEAGDPHAAHRTAHALKSAAAYLGALELSTACAALEAATTSEHAEPGAIRALAERIEHAYTLARAALTELAHADGQLAGA